MPDASNRNTQVFINNRMITKVELCMLQLAGVRCAGNPHFWLDEDGSYQEEGQKNIKGNLWSKAGMKLICGVLSLPSPCKASSSGEEVNDPVGVSVSNYQKRMLQKLLLVGYHGSGTSTIFKQAKILYKAVAFSDDERQNIKLMIQTNFLFQLPTRNSEERDAKTVYSISPRLTSFSDWLLKIMVSGNLEAIFPASTPEYAPLVEELWKDAAVQATLKRRGEVQMLPSVASYFLERVRFYLVIVFTVRFKRHFTSITGRKLYVTISNGLESDNVDEAFRYAPGILKWGDERSNFSPSEYSIYSTETTSSP